MPFIGMYKNIHAADSQALSLNGAGSLPIEISETVATPLPTHLDRVDGLRGTAALIIVVYHLFTGCGNPEWRPWHQINVLRPLHDGFCGVNLFLVLSGFCLYWPYARNPERKLGFVNFMWRRAKRVLPTYYAALLLVPIAYLLLVHILPGQNFPVPHIRDVGDILSHVLLLHALFPAYFRSWYTLTWSLGLEWIWYLLFPAVLWMFRRVGAQRGLLTVAGIVLIYRICVFAALGPSYRIPAAVGGTADVAYNFALSRMLEFGLGMYVAWSLANGMISRKATRICVIATFILLTLAHIEAPFDRVIPIRDALYGLAFATLLNAAVSPHNNILQRIFSGKQLRGIGRYSYSLYLFHLPFVSAICGLLAVNAIRGAKQYLLSLFCLPLILGACYLLFLLVERPFLTPRRVVEK